jgi:hypothetical protein
MPGYQVPLTTVDANTTINNQKLVTTGLNVGKNYIINGAMEIDQRNTATTAVTVSSALKYTVDRWFLYNPGANTISAQRVAGTNTGTKYALQINGAAGFTGGNFGQRVESLHIHPLAGQTVTFSMKIYSTVIISNAQLYGISCSTPSDSSYDVTMFTQGVSIGVGLNNLSVTVTLPASLTNGGEFGLATGTIGAGQYIQISAVQVEAGSSVTPFARSGVTLAGEVASCQRYYWQTDSATSYFYSGFTYSSTIFFSQIPYPVTMRTSPSLLTTGSGSDYRILQGGSFISTSAPTLETSLKNVATLRYTGSGYTVGYGGAGSGNTSNSYLAFSSEL